MDRKEPTFRIGNVPVFGNRILSPMDGYSDLPFRSLARRLGSAMSYSEFINAIDVMNGHPFLHLRLSFEEFERPVTYQVFDDNPDRLLAAVRAIRPHNPDVIDVNMGCSSKNVAGRGAGAGLLRTPEKIAEIFKRLNQEIDLPITGKIRLGWDEHARNYLEVARIIEDNGGKLIAVHGRTKAQGYGGEADWDAIAGVKQAVSVPVLANGDVKTAADVRRIQEHTGADGVLIGRAAIGNPWIFAGLDRTEVPAQEVRRLVREHLATNLAFYGEKAGMILFRKHVVRYVSPYPLPRGLRVSLLTTEDREEFERLLDEAIDFSEMASAANPDGEQQEHQAG